MSITKYNPFFPEFPFRALEDVAKILASPELNAAAAAPTTRPWTPAVDIRETESELILKADLPEVNEKEIDLRIEDGTLVLKGERKFEQEQGDAKKGGYHRIERSYGVFARYFTLPDTIDPEKVKAEYKAGVLTVTLGKKEAAKPKQIKVAIQ